MRHYLKNPLFVDREIEKKRFLVPVSEDIREMRAVYRLNDLGWFIWDNLDKKDGPEGLTSLICGKYGVDKATALRDLRAFLSDLLRIGALSLKEKT
jgi:hypothetical protein